MTIIKQTEWKLVREQTYKIASKFFIYLYIKLNDPSFVLIKATIQKRKIWKIQSKSLQRFTTVK